MDPFVTSLLMGLIFEFPNQLHFGVVGIPINLTGQDCDMKLETVVRSVGFAGFLGLLHVANGPI